MTVDHVRYQATTIDQAVTVAHRFGFCLIKGFFKPEEVGAWETAALAIPPDKQQCDFLSTALLDSLLFDDRVLALARALLGPSLVYYGETNRMVNNEVPFRQLHCDARGMPANIMATHDPAPGHIYEGWRFGVYCRDYTTQSGGLKVLPGSHLRPAASIVHDPVRPVVFKVGKERLDLQVPAYEIYDVPSTPGDLVVFNLRTFHSAGFVRLRGVPDSHLPLKVEKYLIQNRPDLLEPVAAPRNCLFFDYAAPSEGIDLYIKWRLHKTFKADADSLHAEVLGTELGNYRYDLSSRREVAERHGIALRVDRIIGQLVLKRRFNGSLSATDEQRLANALASHREFSPYFPLRNLIKAAA